MSLKRELDTDDWLVNTPRGHLTIFLSFFVTLSNDACNYIHPFEQQLKLNRRGGM